MVSSCGRWTWTGYKVSWHANEILPKITPVHRVQIIERKEREERRKKTYVIPDPRETTNER